MAKSNILKDTIPVEGYRGLFIKNTVGLKRDKLTKKDYGAFSKEKELLFINFSYHCYMKIPTYLNYKNFLKGYLPLIIVALLYFEITDDDPIILIEYIDYGFIATTIIGVFGYIFNKEFITKRFWQFYLPIVVTWDLFSLNHAINLLEYIQLQPLKVLAMLIVFYVVMSPLYIALYLYGHQYSEASDRKRTKVSLLIAFILLSTNATTYLWTYDKANFGWDLSNTATKIITLDLLEHNLPKAKKFLAISINFTFHQASLEDDIEKYATLCRHLDEKTFQLINKYEYESNDTNIIEGQTKVAEMCEKLNIKK